MKSSLSATLDGVVRSPSVWREWIEMCRCTKMNLTICVSLRVEGVD